MRRGVDCLSKSYFEIGGHIIECDIDNLANTSLLSSKTKVPAAKRPERGRNFAKGQASSMLQTEQDSLFTHWLKTVTYPARSAYDYFSQHPQRLVFIAKDPRGIVVPGLQWNLDVVEMNYDYFVKGESHPW